MIWGNGRDNNLPPVVIINYDGNFNNYEIIEKWEVNRNDDPTIIKTLYADNVKQDFIQKEWKNKRMGDKPSIVIDDNNKVVEIWKDDRKEALDNTFRDKDLPAIITTFKKTGRQTKEWFSYKEDKRSISATFHYRYDDKPSIIEEDGTQIWTSMDFGNFYNYSNNYDDKRLDYDYYKKYRWLYIDRENGEPAVIKSDGTKMWYVDGFRNSVNDQPAVIRGDGTKVWYKNDLIHRDNDPAIVYPDGREEWWTNGVKREERELLKLKLKNDDVVNKIMRLI